MKKTLFIIIVIFAFVSCKKEDTEQTVDNIDYYSATLGKTLIYNILEINIDANVNVYDTLKYELKEYFESEYLDNEGNRNIRIERSYRYLGDTTWQILNIWYVSITNNSIETTEDNYRYKRLSLPLYINKNWDGNIYNTKDEEIYEIIKIDEPENIANIDYKNICTVLQTDYENLIEKYYSVEKYAENIGLVYRENINIEQMDPLPGIPYEERIKVGSIYIKELTHISRTENE